MAKILRSWLLEPNESSDKDIYFCPEGLNQENKELIHQVIVIFCVFDVTMLISGLIRTVFFIYVLRQCSLFVNQRFLKRLVFLSWLPLLNLLAGSVLMLLAVLSLVMTISYAPQLTCELTEYSWIFTVVGAYLCAVCHYIFAKEFLTSRIALNSTVRGLEIACSDFITQNSDESRQLLARSTLRRQMSDHQDLTQRKECIQTSIHLVAVLLFTIIQTIGIFYEKAALIGQVIFVFLAAAMYWTGIMGIKALVNKFKLSMPNKRASRIHLINVTSLVLTEMAAAASIQISYGKVGQKIPEDKTETYLRRSMYEAGLLVLCMVLELAASLIAGHLIVCYAKNEKSNLTKDPVTGMEVPSLIFVFN